jgi:hypothetical protein
MGLLNTIAKRQARLGTADQRTAELIRLADGLDLERLPLGTGAEDVIQTAKKELAREIKRARTGTFNILIGNADRNRDGSPQRAVLLEEIVTEMLQHFTDWEYHFAARLANDARAQFDVAVQLRPIERIAMSPENLPLCTVCAVSKADNKYLNRDTFEVQPLCTDCTKAQWGKL